MIKIYDDLLSKEEFKALKNNFMNEMYPWFWSPILTPTIDFESKCEDKYNWLFSNVLYDHHGPAHGGDFFMCIPLVEHPKLNIGEIHRIKINLSPVLSEHILYGFHTDMDPRKIKCTTAIFYLNNNNGWTEFEDGTKVESVENRFVSFPSEMMHSGVATTDTGMRCVINFNYTEKDNASNN